MAIKIYTTPEHRRVDAYTIGQQGISSAELMERAGQQCAYWIMSRFSHSHPVYIFCGKGNNGGDGWVIARYLALNDYRVTVFHTHTAYQLSNDARLNYERVIHLTNIFVIKINDIVQLPMFDSDDIIVDALLGSGFIQPVQGIMSKIIHYLNQMDGIKIAIDIPSGLSGEGILQGDSVAFAAHYTLTFQFPYPAFLFPENHPFVGQWFLLDIGLQSDLPTPYFFMDVKDIVLKTRSPFAYKNEWGHALLLAGSKGMIGAAILSTTACLRTGCGLVTTHVPTHGGAIVHTAIPEAIVSYDPHDEVLSQLPTLKKYSAIGIGPGIGTADPTHRVIKELLESAPCPIVMDADALNILAQHSDWLSLLPAQTILTPHPGEFDRLTGHSINNWDRFQKLLKISAQYKVIIVLKGHHTIIALSDGTCYFNSTGNPGMATAGSGDVLTGMILSLLTQGYTPEKAALCAVFLHGLAGDIAAKELGIETLIASDIIKCIGKAIEQVRNSSLK